jgi:hypothetical protein
MTEEQLQQKIEAGEKLMGTDSVAYRKVFDALEKEPYQLPANFADKVLLQMKAEPNTLFNEYVWLGLGLASFIVAALVSVLLTHFKFSWGSLRFLSGYPGLVVLAVALVAIIQWLDKKVLRPSDF